MFNLEQSIAEWRRQMLAAGIKSPVPLEELEGHLREEIEQQMKAGSNAQDALNSAVQKIGPAQALKGEFDKVVESKKSSKIDHNRLYCTILAILAVFNANTAVDLLISQIRLYNLQLPVGSLPPGLPDASHPWMTAIIFAYTMAMAVTFFARQYRPD